MKRQLLAGALSLVLCTGTVLPVIPAEVNAAQESPAKAQITVSNNRITVGNGYLNREFEISGKTIRTAAIQNSRIHKEMIPQEGSEDFVIHTLTPAGEGSVDPVTEQFPQKALDKTDWSVSIKNAAGTAFSEAGAKTLIDGDTDTYPDEWQVSGNPFTVELDFGENKEIRSMSIDKRPGYHESQYGVNGTMGRFDLYVSEDAEEYTPVYSGNFTEEAYRLHQEGSLYNVGKTVYADFGGLFHHAVRTSGTKILRHRNGAGIFYSGAIVLRGRIQRI